MILEEGNRQGFLLLQTPFGNDMSFIPSEIQGFWKSKIDVESFGTIENENIEYYEFICIDPSILKYVQ